MSIKLNNHFLEKLPFSAVETKPESFPSISLDWLNEKLAKQLGFTFDDCRSQVVNSVFAIDTMHADSRPVAQCYAGHQFGQFNPQLGDGRALILGELEDNHGRLHDLCLKGSGRTPFSRGGDGKAALGSMLREVIISEAMHALGIPTTRSLAVVTTGENVFREEPLPGAILARTAASHIRIGTFQFFAARGMDEEVKKIADYSIELHYPELNSIEQPTEKYLALLKAVCDRQAKTIAQWMGVGFIHGVMNTDNMLISGETIDYGPCAFMEAYNPNAVFSSIDHGGRYAYKNQPLIAQWNLTRFAECLIPLLGSDTEQAVERAKGVLNDFQSVYQREYLKIFSAKMGLSESNPEAPALIERWIEILETQRVDFTNGFHGLIDAAQGSTTQLDKYFEETDELDKWLKEWRSTISSEEIDQQQLIKRLSSSNPWVIPRNQQVENALIAASESNDLSKFEDLYAALQNPFSIKKENPALAIPASAEFTATFKTFCGT